MFINALIIGGWLMVTGIFGIGFYVKERTEEKKNVKKENPWLF